MDKYTSIDNLHKAKDVLLHEVVVTEKLHGTNVRFGKVDGQFKVGSRNRVIFDGKVYNKEFDGYGFFSWLEENLDVSLLPDGFVFYGEFFGANVQKGVTYFDPNEARKHFATFDVKKGEHYVDWNEVEELAAEICQDTVPVIGTGKFHVDQLVDIINAPSVWAKSQGVESVSEGVVIKPLQEVRDRHGNRLIAKFKNAKFNEKQKAPKMPKKKSPYRVAGEAYCTPARVENTIDKLRQEVSEELSMEHIPLLLKLFCQDVAKDADDLPENKKDRKEFMKGAQSGVVPLYREWLLQSF